MVASTLTQATMAGPVAYTALVGATLIAAAPTVSRVTTLTRATMVASTGAMTVDAGLPGTYDPMVRVPLLGTVSGATADSVTWSLQSSSNAAVTALTLIPSDPAAVVTSYIAPATVNGVVLVWRLTAHKAGQADAVGTATHSINNHVGPWVWKVGGGRKPVKMSAVYPPDSVPTAEGFLVDAGFTVDSGQRLRI